MNGLHEPLDGQLPSFPDYSDSSHENLGPTVSLKNMTPEQRLQWFGAENIHNGAHFMPSEDNETYQALCETDLKEAIRFLRDKWAEHADHEFMQGFVLVHWVSDSERGLESLSDMVGNSQSGAEISTQGYRDSESLADDPRWLQAKFGVVVRGRVNLASNADIQTNQWHNLSPDDDVKRRKYTEWANRLMTRDDNCVSPYEFAVDQWQPVAIIADPDTALQDNIAAIASEHSLPVIDSRQNTLFESQDKQL